MAYLVDQTCTNGLHTECDADWCLCTCHNEGSSPSTMEDPSKPIIDKPVTEHERRRYQESREHRRLLTEFERQLMDFLDEEGFIRYVLRYPWIAQARMAAGYDPRGDAGSG